MTRGMNTNQFDDTKMRRNGNHANFEPNLRRFGVVEPSLESDSESS